MEGASEPRTLRPWLAADSEVGERSCGTMPEGQGPFKRIQRCGEVANL